MAEGENVKADLPGGPIRMRPIVGKRGETYDPLHPPKLVVGPDGTRDFVGGRIITPGTQTVSEGTAAQMQPQPEEQRERGAISERDVSQDIQRIIQDRSLARVVFGKFPNGASVAIGSENDTFPPNNGTRDYTVLGEMEKAPLFFGGIPNMVDGVVRGPLINDRDRLPRSLGSDTQFVMVDALPGAPGLPEGATMVAYQFEQDGSDFSSRPIRQVVVATALPSEAADQIVEGLTRDPDAIEAFYDGVAPGLEGTDTANSRVRRIGADRLRVFDFRGIPPSERAAFLAADYSLPELLSSMEMAGQIPVLPYRDKTAHGDTLLSPSGFIPRVSDQERTPVVDVARGQEMYQAALANANMHRR